MSIFVGIDFGLKRTGIAVTDPMKMIASPLETVETEKLLPFLEEINSKEQIEKIVLGKPYDLKGGLNPIEENILKFVATWQKKQPNIEIIRIDERFTSTLSKNILLESGIGRMKRRDKSLLDKISASILLETYLNSNYCPSK